MPVGRVSNGAAFCAAPVIVGVSGGTEPRRQHPPPRRARAAPGAPKGSFTSRFRVPGSVLDARAAACRIAAVARRESARRAVVVSSGRMTPDTDGMQGRIACVNRCLRVSNGERGETRRIPERPRGGTTGEAHSRLIQPSLRRLILREHLGASLRTLDTPSALPRSSHLPERRVHEDVLVTPDAGSAAGRVGDRPLQPVVTPHSADERSRRG